MIVSFFFFFSLSLDINECLVDPFICGVGTCVNTDGGYNCVCPEGYVLLPGGSKQLKFSITNRKREPTHFYFNNEPINEANTTFWISIKEKLTIELIHSCSIQAHFKIVSILITVISMVSLKACFSFRRAHDFVVIIWISVNELWFQCRFFLPRFLIGECVDMRKELCYMNFTDSSCANPMSQPQTLMVCCCSMGAGWGKDCEECPAQGSRNSFKYIHH